MGSRDFDGTPGGGGDGADAVDESCLALLKTLCSPRTCSPSQCMPALRWLPELPKKSKAELAKDLTAGLTVAAVLIPQGMAYAMLAELPPVSGLYTAMLPSLGYMLFGTCVHLSVGPFALVSMLSAKGIEALVPDPSADPEAAVRAGAILSLMVGVELFLFWLLRLGFMASFLSDSVISGFCTASALIIPFSQLKYAFQLSVPGGTFLETLQSLLAGILQGQTNVMSFGIFAISLVVLIALQRLNKSPSLPPRLAFIRQYPLPAELIVLVLTTSACKLLDLGACPGPCVRLLGEVPAGLPPLHVPSFKASELSTLLEPSLITALMAYILSMSVSKVFGHKFGYEVDNNQELFAFSVANILSGISGGYPASGTFSRTAIAAGSGATSPLHGLFTVLMVGFVLAFCTKLVATLPLAALAAIVVMAFKSLLLDGFAEARKTFRVSASNFIVWQVAFWATLLTNVTRGLTIAVVADVLDLFYKTTQPSHSLLGRMNESSYRDMRFWEEAVPVEGVLIFRFNGPLHFANRDSFLAALWEQIFLFDKVAPADSLKGKSERLLKTHTGPLRAVVIDASPMSHIDMSACRALVKLSQELRSRAVCLIIGHCNYECRKMMDDMGLFLPSKNDDGVWMPSFDVRWFRDLHDAVDCAESGMNKRRTV